eukprot:PhM_4_TR15067/c0_g1_i1/m.504
MTSSSTVVGNIIASAGDLASILGITPTSTADELKRRYKRIALSIHPDKCADPRAAEAFAIVQKAYTLAMQFVEHQQQQQQQKQTSNINATAPSAPPPPPKQPTRTAPGQPAPLTPPTTSSNSNSNSTSTSTSSSSFTVVCPVCFFKFKVPMSLFSSSTAKQKCPQCTRELAVQAPPQQSSVPPPRPPPPAAAAAKAPVMPLPSVTHLAQQQRQANAAPNNVTVPPVLPTFHKASAPPKPPPPMIKTTPTATTTTTVAPLPSLAQLLSDVCDVNDDDADGTSPRSVTTSTVPRPSANVVALRDRDPNEPIMYKCPWCATMATAEIADLDLPTVCDKCGSTFLLTSTLVVIHADDALVAEDPSLRKQTTMCGCGAAVAGRCVFCDDDDDDDD